MFPSKRPSQWGIPFQGSYLFKIGTITPLNVDDAYRFLGLLVKGQGHSDLRKHDRKMEFLFYRYLATITILCKTILTYKDPEKEASVTLILLSLNAFKLD